MITTYTVKTREGRGKYKEVFCFCADFEDSADRIFRGESDGNGGHHWAPTPYHTSDVLWREPCNAVRLLNEWLNVLKPGQSYMLRSKKLTAFCSIPGIPKGEKQ
jgi:hypothetical protein